MRTCVHCGCTDDNACARPQDHNQAPLRCEWVDVNGDDGICSFCWEADDAVDELVTPSRELILPGDPEFHL